MTNLDSIFKSRDITLPTKVHLVKAMVFPVVMYGCVFLPGESYGQRSLAGYSPWGRKESDMTEQLSMHTDSAPGLLNQHLHLTSSLENRGAHKALRSTTPGHFNVHLPRL